MNTINKLKMYIKGPPETEDNPPPPFEELVMSGGGSRGISFIGAFQALEEFDLLCKINTVYGVSAGAIVATVLCAGFKPREMYEILMEYDMGQLRSIELFKILSHYGIESGKKVIKWV